MVYSPLTGRQDCTPEVAAGQEEVYEFIYHYLRNRNCAADVLCLVGRR